MASRGYDQLTPKEKDAIAILRQLPFSAPTPAVQQSSVLNPIHASNAKRRKRSTPSSQQKQTPRPPINPYKIVNHTMTVYTLPDNTMALEKCPLASCLFEFTKIDNPIEKNRKKRFRNHLKKTHGIRLTLRHVVSTPLLVTSETSQDLSSLFPDTLENGGGSASLGEGGSMGSHTITADSYKDMLKKRSQRRSRSQSRDLDFSIFSSPPPQLPIEGWGGGRGSQQGGVRTARTYQQVLRSKAQLQKSGKS